MLLKSREELNIFTRVYVSARFRKVRKVEKPQEKKKQTTSCMMKNFQNPQYNERISSFVSLFFFVLGVNMRTRTRADADFS